MAYTKMYLSLHQKIPHLSFYRYIKFLDTKHFSTIDIANTAVTDQILQNLKSATDPRDVLTIISQNQKEINNTHSLQALRTLFSLQKYGNLRVPQEQIIKHPDFAQLCKRLKLQSRTIEINETIEALKILSYMGVPSNSNITQTLLQLIRHRINELTLQHVVFLDFLIKKFEKNPLVEALQIALPLIFQIKLPVTMDYENIVQLTEYLQYASKNEISDPCVQSIVSALTLHGEDIDLHAAKSIIWSLCDIKKTHISHEKLLNNAFAVLSKRILSLAYEDMETTMAKVLDKYLSKQIFFYNENFFDSCIDFVIEKDIGFIKAIWIAKKLSRIGHTSLPLMDYLGQKCAENPKLLSECRPGIYFTTITALSNTDYKPKHWDVMKDCLMSNIILTTGKDELPWTKCGVELASLGCFNETLLNRVFCTKFLDKYLSRDYNLLDNLQLLSLYQAVQTLHNDYKGILPDKKLIQTAIDLNNRQVDSTLHSALVTALGGVEFVAKKVYSRLGHFIDYVAVIQDDYKAVPVAQSRIFERTYIEDIFVPPNSQIICILGLNRGSFSLNCNRIRGNVALSIRTIEAMGHKVLPIILMNWESLSDHEKIPYLLREIKLKTSEVPVSNVSANL